jgi:hypothetical protein
LAVQVPAQRASVSLALVVFRGRMWKPVLRVVCYGRIWKSVLHVVCHGRIWKSVLRVACDELAGRLCVLCGMGSPCGLASVAGERRLS